MEKIKLLFVGDKRIVQNWAEMPKNWQLEKQRAENRDCQKPCVIFVDIGLIHLPLTIKRLKEHNPGSIIYLVLCQIDLIKDNTLELIQLALDAGAVNFFMSKIDWQLAMRQFLAGQ